MTKKQQAMTLLNVNDGLQTIYEPTLPSEFKPEPVRPEFLKQMSSQDLDQLQIGLNLHHPAESFSDRVALKLVLSLRKPVDLFFGKRYIHRAMLLETVAAVPGMVASAVKHLRALRHLESQNDPYIHHLMHEVLFEYSFKAENERMHLYTWLAIAQPNLFDRVLVKSVQVLFLHAYTLFYLFSPKTAHRLVGYLEEQAMVSYTCFLEAIDQGLIKNIEAPEIAKKYWQLGQDATLRDVVLAVRADEAQHRDVNHYLANLMLEEEKKSVWKRLFG